MTASAFPWIAASKLWLVLDREASHPHPLTDVVRRAAEGGIDAVLCRLKDMPAEELADTAADVCHACRQAGVRFVISHEIELGIKLAADGVQIGIHDDPCGMARSAAGQGMALGYSAHSVNESRAMEQGADYVFLGPIFPTPAKLKYGPPLGLGVVKPALALPKPVVFIGGINLESLPQLTAQGGARVAVIGALQRVPDIAAAAAQLRALLTPAD